MRCECFISAAILLECFARSSVIHSYQPQSAGGGGVSGGGAVFERENALYVFHEQGAFAYKQERTHKIPDHMMQKSVALHGFLHHMVRNLVGTFLLVGKRTLLVEDVKRILALKDRSAAAHTAPASGLWLVRVDY